MQCMTGGDFCSGVVYAQDDDTRHHQGDHEVMLQGQLSFRKMRLHTTDATQ